ncbi:hypothetical protein JCGZ_22496 [Jatropha curcas]|uniref:Uncharacterized protein n=1 Tax=Jatropha curcas TaxID=180498 RepID=A0A067LBJ3_JATCU|nr:hypothetical protein JCGZ_22496 [Jatropha curcas]
MLGVATVPESPVSAPKNLEPEPNRKINGSGYGLEPNGSSYGLEPNGSSTVPKSTVPTGFPTNFLTVPADFKPVLADFRWFRLELEPSIHGSKTGGTGTELV